MDWQERLITLYLWVCNQYEYSLQWVCERHSFHVQLHISDEAVLTVQTRETHCDKCASKACQSPGKLCWEWERARWIVVEGEPEFKSGLCISLTAW